MTDDTSADTDNVPAAPNDDAPAAAPPELTPEQAQTKIAELKADPDFAARFLDQRNAGHRSAVQQMQALHAAAKGEASDAEPRSQIREKIEALKADPDFAARLLDSRHPGHRSAVAEMNALHEAEERERESKADEDGETEGGHEPGSEDDFREAMRLAFVRPELEVGEVVKEFEVYRGWLGEAGASANEAAEAVNMFNQLSQMPEAQLHDPTRIEQAQQTCVQTLQEWWGDGAGDKLADAKRAVEKLNGEDGLFVSFLEETRLGDDPRMVRFLANAATRNGW